MAKNIENKSRISSAELGKVAELARSATSQPPVLLRQVDTFYQVPSGRLKLRQFENGSAELIAYQRAAPTEREQPMESSYVRSPCADPASLHAALAQSLGVRGVVRKRRELILLGQTRVHLDEVEGLGSFLELEVVLEPQQSAAEGEEIARGIMEQLEVTAESLFCESYIDLLELRDRTPPVSSQET